MDVLAHLVVPLLCLLAARVPVRRALALAPLGLLADVDALVGPHRAVLHNLFAVALVALVVYAVAQSGVGRVADPGRLAGLAALAYGSHLLLDLPWGVALLWPLVPQALVLHPALLVDMGGALPVLLPRLVVLVLPRALQFADAPLELDLAAPPVHVMVGAEALMIALLFGATLGIQRPWARRAAADAAAPASAEPVALLVRR